MVGQTKAALTLQMVNDRLVAPRDEIEAMRISPISMISEGQLDKLSDEEVRVSWAGAQG